MPYIQYAGKKKFPIKFENDVRGIVIKFSRPDEIIEINQDDLDWILKYNPTGFVKEVRPERVSTRANFPGQEQIEQVAEQVETSGDLVCPHCFKQYKDEFWYEKHVEKCKGSDDNASE
jgi:hypothetical protein